MKMTGHLQTVKDELFEYRETKAFKTSKINMKKPYEAHQLFVGWMQNNLHYLPSKR